MSYLTIDSETDIQYDIVKDKKTGKCKREEALHGGTFRDPRNDIYTWIYADHPKRVKVVHNKKGFKRRLTPDMVKMLKKTKTLILMNGKFDICYIWNDPDFKQWLINGGKVWDIQLVRYLLSGHRHQFPSLAEMQELYLGIKTKVSNISKLFKRCIGAKQIVNKGEKCPRIWRDYNKYAVEDGRTPLLIFKQQLDEVRGNNMMPIVELYNQYLLALCMIETNGLHVDLKQTEETYKEFQMIILDYLKKAQAEVEEIWSDPRLDRFNINSWQDKSRALFGGTVTVQVRRGTGDFVKTKSSPNYGKEKTKLFDEVVTIKGLDVEEKFRKKSTTEGLYQTNKHITEKIVKESKSKKAVEFCKNLKEAARFEKMSNTYLKAFLDRSIDGIIYPNYNNTGTNTSRLSSSKPNVQNIPTNDEYMKKAIQGLIKAPEDEVCCQIDFSQLEVYGQALLTNDFNLINDLKSGVDFHVKRMVWLYPEVTYDQGYELAVVKEDPKWKSRRKEAKPIGFGKQYGKMPESMAKDTGIDIELLKEVFKKEDEEYPQVVEFEKAVVREVEASARLSRKWDISSKYTEGSKQGQKLARKYVGDVELLPIRKRDKVNYFFNRQEYRHVGFYKSPTGKIYAFEEYGSLTKNEDIFRYYKPTQMKNYMIQGCLHGETSIITKEYGKRNIKDLIYKDLTVWTDGGYSKATCLPSGKKQQCLIEMKDGNIIKCSPEHKFKYVNPSTLYEGWIKAKDIIEKVSNGKRVAIKLGQEVEFESCALLPEPPINNRPANFKYVSANTIGNFFELGIFLGRVASDGTVVKNKNVRLIIAEHEENILKQLKNICGRVGIYRHTVKHRRNRSQYLHYIDFDSASLANQISECKQRIPKECWKSKRLMQGYLKGMFDGDGTISNDGLVILTFGKQEYKIEWAREIQLALRLFGIRSRVKCYSTCTQVKVMKADTPVYAEKIGFLNINKVKKLNKFQGIKRSSYNIAYVKTAINTGKMVEMFDIVNSSNKTFCANGLVTHNTAGDIQAATTVEMFKYLLENSDKIRLVNEIHDSKWFYIKKQYVDEVVPKLCGIMESVKTIFKRRFGIETDLAFPVGAEIGPNFAELKTYKVEDNG